MSIYHQRTDSKMNSEPPPEHSAGKSSSTTEDSSSAPGAGMNQGTKRAREDGLTKVASSKRKQTNLSTENTTEAGTTASDVKVTPEGHDDVVAVANAVAHDAATDNKSEKQNEKFKSQTGPPAQQGEKIFDLRNYTNTRYSLIIFRRIFTQAEPSPTSSPAPFFYFHFIFIQYWYWYNKI